MKTITLNDIKNDLLGIAMELEAEAADRRRRNAARRHLQARRGIECHYESLRLAGELNHEPVEGDDITPFRRAGLQRHPGDCPRRLPGAGSPRQAG
ncbi:hypothetical protein C7446_0039 [Kushneria sinocarnis]|uniref:Uncharacterized protein n=1 Tax=Kushneria sinocarnis TaxID=595502 RepID=A0A420X056_9GAMM|nr:hypothetical protein [Kushneria sinocarnis]RKR07231.1 hypothetical protein C7446_0039 [Kushneria sinocarnis]